jgi:galactokinase
MAHWASRLGAIYGDQAAIQEERYQKAIAQFIRLYGPGSFSLYRVSGRVNLIGEHTDYQQGYVLPVALDKDFVFVARPRQDALINLSDLEAEFAPRQFAASHEIAPGPAGDWGNYARGAVQMLWRMGEQPLAGMDVLIDGEAPFGVPRGAGVSSSTALTVGVGLVFADLNGLRYTPAELAWLLGEAEWYVGTRGGIMDQFIVLLGQRDHALFLDCRARPGVGQIPSFNTEQVQLPAGYNLIVADTKTRHQNTRSEFNVRVAEGRIGVALLKRRYPEITHLRDLERFPWAEVEPLLPEALTHQGLEALGLRLADLIDVKLPDTGQPFRVRARCRHIVSENARVKACVAALRGGEIERVGALLKEAHRSVRDDYGASCRELDTLVRLAEEVEGVIGARMTGAGWGGCIIALARAGCEQAFAQYVAPRYQQATGLATDIFICRSGDGAQRVGEGSA